MTKPRILFRADGNVQMGLGHLIRSGALAEMLVPGFAPEFVCREIAPEVAARFELSGFTVHRIEREIEFLSMIESTDLVVLDGYKFDLGYQHQVRSKCAALVCIDDLLKADCHADLIINQSPGARETAYNALPGAEFALGLDYVLLRPAFLNMVQQQSGTDSGDSKSVFICFGGSDAQNLTQSTWMKALESGRFDRIVLVTGVSYEHFEELKSEVATHSGTELYRDISADHMLQLMLECGVKVVPSSGILFEALTTGGTVLCGYYTENQMPNHSHAVRMGTVIDVGIFSDKDLEYGFEAIDRFTSRKPLIDGRSPERLLAKVQELYHKFVPA